MWRGLQVPLQVPFYAERTQLRPLGEAVGAPVDGWFGARPDAGEGAVALARERSPVGSERLGEGVAGMGLVSLLALVVLAAIVAWIVGSIVLRAVGMLLIVAGLVVTVSAPDGGRAAGDADARAGRALALRVPSPRLRRPAGRARVPPVAARAAGPDAQLDVERTRAGEVRVLA